MSRVHENNTARMYFGIRPGPEKGDGIPVIQLVFGAGRDGTESHTTFADALDSLRGVPQGRRGIYHGLLSR